jgi:hypothetical protein
VNARRTLAAIGAFVILGCKINPHARHHAPPPRPIGIVINGEALPLDPRPLLDHGILLVPVQRTIHALGLDFEREGSRMITHVGSKTVVLRDHSKMALVDDTRVPLDAPVMLRNDVFYAPLRFFTSVLDAQANLFHGTVIIVAQLVGRAGNGVIVEGNRTLHIGTVTNVDLNSDPPTVTLAFNGAVHTIGITPNAIITLRDIAVDVDTPGELSDIRPGDYAQILMEKNGAVSSVVDAFGSRYGTIAALNGSQFVLQDGHVIAPDRDTVISLNGRPASLSDLQVGDLVTVRYNVETAEILEVDADRSLAATTAQSGTASIDAVSINASQPLRGGQRLVVTMHGAPGGAATFDVGEYVQNVAMTEQTPGTYVGTYAIPQSANFTGVPIVAHLRMHDGSSVEAESAQTLSAAATPPGISSVGPADGEVVNDDEPAIYATFVSQAVPVNPSSIRLEVNGLNVSDDCLRTPNFVQFLPGTTYHGTVRVTVLVADYAGNIAKRSWSFTVADGY